MIEAVNPTITHLTSLLYIYKVFGNLYMLWMCIWMYHHQACGILPQIWASLRWYVTSKVVIEAVDPSTTHLTDVHMDVIWMYHHHVMAAHVDQACGHLRQIWASLRWYVTVKSGDWGCRPNHHSSHITIIYIMCLTTFICCGCAYGCVPTTSQQPLMPTKLVEFCHKSGQVSDDMWR